MTIQEYIDKLNTRYKSGITTEHSYRGDLQNLLESIIPDTLITNEPTRIKCGAPDYILTKKEIPVGYIEAKDIGDDLGNKKHKEQFTRYKEALANLIITNYLDFWVYKDGELVATYSIGYISDGKINGKPEQYEAFTALIKDFSTYIGQTIKSAQKLAVMMASKAKLLASVIHEALESDVINAANSTLQEQLQAFKDILIHDITEKGFADIYAQTIAYGMFAARLHDPTLETFSRIEAAQLIPKSNPFLRKLFGYIAGIDLDDRLVWIVDALADIFRATDVKALLKNFGKATKQHDPIIHFYETFLSEYDPGLRKARGVWYTPEPVVNFIVRAVDDILKSEFNLQDGLADTSKVKIKRKVKSKATADQRSKLKEVEIEEQVHRVQILDPATGTGTFLAEVIRQIHEKFQGQEGIWSSYVENHLLPRINGFELLMASYAMAHLKLDILLTETGYKSKTDQRLRVYLTNSLEEHHPDTGTLFANWLSSEANEANQIKRDVPVMCVIGNPPYLGESKNNGEWILTLMKDYKREPSGGKLQEKNTKPLNNDYVKFIRYAQYFIDKTEEGILAFINPNSYLDNPTFRGMRWNLLNTYDKLYTINLHGNKSTNDENVFKIKQPVSINIFIKTNRKAKFDLGTVMYYDLYGTRTDKYDFLLNNTISDIDFQIIDYKEPQYYFVPKDFKEQNEYDSGFNVSTLFPVNSVGIITARDHFTIKETKEEVYETIKRFISMDNESARKLFSLGKDVRDWKVEFAKADITNTGVDINKIAKINYRPFDVRYTYFTGNSRGFHCTPRGDVMKHFLHNDNLGLITCRQTSEEGWAHCSITNTIVDDSRVSNRTKERGYVFPLYFYPEGKMFAPYYRKPNLNEQIVDKIGTGLGMKFIHEKGNSPGTFAPIDILDYIYSILHSPTYRERYKQFLKIDFPRVPYPADVAKFWELVKLGGELRQIHLLESSIVTNYITSYPVDGSNTVEKPKYKDGKVWINEEQYFEDVPEVTWAFYIGSYQPAQKWLKDRKGRELSIEDIMHYQKIIVALAETDRIMKEIDKVLYE